MLAKPDPATFQMLPWRTEGPGTARMFCDLLNTDGTPSVADPRYVLQRALTKAADLGFTFYTHPEIEFFLFEQGRKPGDKPVPIDQGATSTTCRRGTRTTSAGPRSRCSSRWASPSSSATTRQRRVRTRSTCATPTP